VAALRTVQTATLEIAYEESGPPGGVPVVLLHGFPDDVRAWDETIEPLVAAGFRTLVPYLRGYGPTRFLDAAAPRMAQQAAIGQDLIDFLDALALPPAALAGYDWGGRAACITAILRPERVRALVTIGGYNVQNTVAPPRPASALQERANWYQWYFNTARGVAGLTANRREICRLLWRDWSPGYRFDDATFEATAASWDNPDFVPIVIHSYRHRHGHAPGEPRFDSIERHLATRPGHHRAQRGAARGGGWGGSSPPGRAGPRPLPRGDPARGGGGRGTLLPARAARRGGGGAAGAARLARPVRAWSRAATSWRLRARDTRPARGGTRCSTCRCC
jgi:pimeloyl-ACP methyl ester carboxylesterase